MSPTDKQMLDWIQSKQTGYGLGWVCRPSTTGRGFRIHETTGCYGLVHKDIRKAIAMAMEVEAQGRIK